MKFVTPIQQRDTGKFKGDNTPTPKSLEKTSFTANIAFNTKLAETHEVKA